MRLFITLFSIALSLTGFAEKPINVSSPDGRIVFAFQLAKAAPTYRVTFGNKTLVETSDLTLIFRDTGLFGPDLNVGKPVVRIIDESYMLVVGKAKRYVTTVAKRSSHC